MDDKIIAKEILIKMIETNNLSRREFPEVETSVELICEAYRRIFKTVKDC